LTNGVDFDSFGTSFGMTVDEGDTVEDSNGGDGMESSFGGVTLVVEVGKVVVGEKVEDGDTIGEEEEDGTDMVKSCILLVGEDGKLITEEDARQSKLVSSSSSTTTAVTGFVEVAATSSFFVTATTSSFFGCLVVSVSIVFGVVGAAGTVSITMGSFGFGAVAGFSVSATTR